MRAYNQPTVTTNPASNANKNMSDTILSKLYDCVRDKKICKAKFYKYLHFEKEI